MSNLGLYQTMVTLAKKLGGPKNLFAAAMAMGYVTFRGVEAGVKKIWKAWKSRKQYDRPKNSRLYTASVNATGTHGLTVTRGQKIRVLEVIDDDAILIDIIGDRNNPYVVAPDYLESISDYEQT